MPTTIYIHTDGSSNKEKTVGGWAFCLSNGKEETPFYHTYGQLEGTHNKAELSAMLNALYYIYGNHTECTKIVAVTDSRYVADPITYDSLRVWENQNWTTSAGTPVANLELWKEMKHLLGRFHARRITLDVQWVRGHNGNKLNELVDKLAVKARKNGTKNELYG